MPQKRSAQFAISSAGAAYRPEKCGNALLCWHFDVGQRTLLPRVRPCVAGHYLIARSTGSGGLVQVGRSATKCCECNQGHQFEPARRATDRAPAFCHTPFLSAGLAALCHGGVVADSRQMAHDAPCYLIQRRNRFRRPNVYRFLRHAENN